MKKILKYFGLALLFFVLLLVIAALFTQTPTFKNWARKKTVSLAQTYINGEISVAKLRGNLFQHIEWEGLSISQHGEPVVTVAAAKLDYNPLALLSNHLQIFRLELIKPEIKLIQQDDGTWNLAQLIKMPDTTAAADTTAPWSFDIVALEIESGGIELRGLDSLQASVPRRFDDLQLELRFSWIDRRAKLNLDSLSVEADDPHISFNMMPSQLEYEEEKPGEKNLEVKVVAELAASDLRVQDMQIYGDPRLRLEAEGSLQNLIIKLNLLIGGGEINLWSRLNIAAEPYAYQLKGEANQLNLEEITHKPAFDTDLNFDFYLNGQGTQAQNLSGDFWLEFLPSHFNQVAIDSARVEASWRGKILELAEFTLISPLAEISANGRLSESENDAIAFTATFPNLAHFSALTAMDSLRGQGLFSGHVRGPVDSLRLTGAMRFENAGVQEVTVDSLESDLSGMIAAGHHAFELNGEARQIRLSPTQIFDANFNVAYVDSLVNFGLEMQQHDAELRGNAAGRVALQPVGWHLTLGRLEIEMKNQRWIKTAPATEVYSRGSQIEISELTMANGNQRITVAGILDTLGASQLQVRVDSLSIAEATKQAKAAPDFDGTLNLEITLSQTLKRPRLEGAFSITDGFYFAEQFKEFSGKFGYAENALKWNLFFSKTGSGSLLTSTGLVPARLSLMPFQGEVPDDEPVEIRLQTAALDLSFIKGFMQTNGEFQGQLFADIALKNTLQDLRGDGSIRLVGGKINLPALGTKYDNVNFSLRLRDQEIILDAFNIESPEGSLRILSGSLALSQRQIERFAARLRADNFQVINTEKMAAAISGDLELAGSIQALEFKGNVVVPEAHIYYPTWIEEDTTVRLMEKPSFIISTDTVEFDPRGALRFQKRPVKKAKQLFTETDFYKSLDVRLSLTIERNVWLRSEEANIEVEGELEFQKPKGEEDFFLFGPMNVVRGYYDLQGKRFEIERGEVVFTGNPELNPELNIEAVHEFIDRSDGISGEHEIRVTITGTQLAPEFRFTLDGKEADQRDVFAILLFGRPFSELGTGEQASLAQMNLEGSAAGFITAQLFKELGGALGRELNLDLLELESGEDLGHTKVRVGKYVTQGVFISVSQGFGEAGGQAVLLEYALPRKLPFRLFLQAKMQGEDTAADLIWKVDW